MICRLLVLLTVTFWCSHSVAEPFPIGAILPLSGDSALGGQACLNGMLLAKKKLDLKGANQIKILHENNESNASKTVSAYHKLRVSDGIKAAVVWEDSAGHALAPITERDKVVLTVTGGDKSIVEGRKYAFLYWLMLDTETEAIVKEIKRRGYKRIARVVTQHPGPLFMKAELDRLNNIGQPYIVDEEILPDTKDFKGVISKIKRHADVDAVVAFLWSGQIGVFAKQLKQAGITGTIIGSDIFEDQNELTIAEGALDGAWFPQIADPLPTFQKEYEENFPGASIYSSGNCYDIVMLIDAALKAHSEPHQYLEKLQNFSGALGTVSATNYHRFIFPLLIREVVHGKFQTVNE